MKRNIFYLFMTFAAFSFVLSGCGDDGAVPVTGVRLNVVDTTLAPAETLQLAATVLPSDAANNIVSWASSSADVATVNPNGLVTAVAEGAAVVTVTTDDGKYNAVCSLRVVKPEPVTGVQLNVTDTVLAPAETLQLTATVLPAHAANQKIKSWVSDKTSVATVDPNGLVTAVAEGTAVVTVTTDDGAKTASCTVTVSTDILGTVTFRSDKTWAVGSQTWSDVVMASKARGKDAFNGGDRTSHTYKADLRQNVNNYGDLFSYEAVVQYQDQLCPGEWRVPRTADFVDLDAALGGSGENRDVDMAVLNRLISDEWGGEYGGHATGDLGGALQSQGTHAYYWTTDYLLPYGMCLALHTSGAIAPMQYAYKNLGMMVRCVK